MAPLAARPPGRLSGPLPEPVQVACPGGLLRVVPQYVNPSCWMDLVSCSALALVSLQKTRHAFLVVSSGFLVRFLVINWVKVLGTRACNTWTLSIWLGFTVLGLGLTLGPQDLKDFARKSSLDVVYSEIGRERDGKG